MSHLTFRLRDDVVGPVDAGVLLPEQLAGLSLADVERIPIRCATRERPVGDLFDVSGRPSESLVICAHEPHLSHAGAGLQSGNVHIDGNAGNLAGINLRRGRLTITGCAGDYLGAGMRGGGIEVTGPVGDFAGAALPAHRIGQSGGSIVIRGDAGDRLGDSLRRGTLIVDGNCGKYAASRLIAGTILIAGAFGAGIGVGMRRGTLLLCDDECVRRNAELCSPAAAGESLRFVDGGPLAPVYATLMYTALSRLGGEISWLRTGARRMLGDRLIGGEGEILIRS